MMKNNCYNLFIFFCLFFSGCADNLDKNKTEAEKHDEMNRGSKSFKVIDNNQVEFEVVQLSYSELQKFEFEKRLTFDDSISKKYGVTVYRLDKQKAIVEESGNYAVYPSIDVLQSVLERYRGPYKQEILFGKNPFGNSFPEKTEIMIYQMFNDLKLDASNLGREKVFERLDSIIVKNRDNVFFDKNFLNLIALVGKYIIQEFNAKWVMILSDDKKTWNPFLEIDGEKVFFADYIREDFFDISQKRPLTESFESTRDIIRLNIISKRK